ncbi:DUF6507 family protein [Paenarthrobacter aurescens]|jgi:hypothetical protein|nr:DUF6507 family protein [Paenarthrobacter aurescens]
MTLNWNIDTAGTHAVLTTAASNIDAQNEAAKGMGTAISDAGAALGTGLVAQALNEFVEQSLALKVKFIAGRSAAIVQGTNDALMVGDGWEASYNYDEKPVWEFGDPVNDTYAQELYLFPRDEEHIPDWFEEEMKGATWTPDSD